jgi:CheY-like chemotaxis protein
VYPCKGRSPSKNGSETDNPMISAQPEASPAAEAESRKRILFVDDEPLLTNLGEKFLRRLGYEPVTANCPLQALTLFQEQVFDAVVTDLTMPWMSGIELARAIHQSQPSMPVVLTTAFHHKLEGQSAASLGCSALLLKPYNLASMGDVLKRALGRIPLAEPPAIPELAGTGALSVCEEEPAGEIKPASPEITIGG